MSIKQTDPMELRRSVQPIDAEIAGFVRDRPHRTRHIDTVFLAKNRGISSILRTEPPAKAARGSVPDFAGSGRGKRSTSITG